MIRKMILLCLFVCLPLAAELPRIFPPALEQGDLIALVFPASFLSKNSEEGQEIIDRKSAWLQNKGYRTVCYPAKVNIHGYLAGTDKERAEALMDAWRDPEVKAIWCFRGGYGTPRILDLLDYELIKANPKIFIGMSDITALHQALQTKTGLVTFLAPVLNFFDEKNSFNAEYAFSELDQILVKHRKGIFQLPNGSSLQVLRPGQGQGKIVGGNLALIASLCGTKWQLNTENKILLLEDIGEEPYRIDRMLWQLREAGLLDHPSAVLLGSWTDCKSTMRNSLSLEEVLTHYFGEANYPVITGFPFGHEDQTTVPLNVICNLYTNPPSVETLEEAVMSNE